MSTTTEKHSFQAEVRQLLDIVIHSLYTDRDIFLRELVSNASDSLEKLRHLQMTEPEVTDSELPLEINITSDEEAGTITIQDYGIGMTREELVENLGTIAHSGSKAFLNALKEKGSSNENLIGQFGVGFYSAFMVASQVEVYTHSWKKDAGSFVWRCDGSGSYEIEESQSQSRGCKIVLTLKEDCKEFAKLDRIKGIIRKYSSFVQFPVNIAGERFNNQQALWLRSKSEIKEEEYTEFYKFQANAFDTPRYRLHFNADAPITINALLFVPEQNQERFGFGRMEDGVSLYCRKVLIDDEPSGLLPEWMRFVRGVVDSADLPLNISRETMQDSVLVQKLNQVISKRFIKMLDEESRKNPEAYDKFYEQFGIFIKEGIATDFTHKEALGKLLRFESSATEKGKTTSLADYVSRMKEEQKEIYYLQAPSRTTIEEGPYLEAFKARGLEVIYLLESADEVIVNQLREFDGKQLVSADQSDIELEEVENNNAEKLSTEEMDALCAWAKEQLGERVEKVSAGKRLVDSPALALNADKMMTSSMRKMMKMMNPEQEELPIKVNLELNAAHPLIKKLNALRSADEETAKLLGEQILDTSMLAAGYLEDPRSVANRLYKVLEKLGK